jgi:hypothetical protein
MIISIRLNENRLRMCAFEHFLQIWKKQILREAVLLRISRSERLIWFGDAYDFDFWIVERVVEKSLDMSVNQTDDADTQWWRPCL